MNAEFKPKFLRHYADGFATLQGAVNQYHADVASAAFPGVEERY